MYNFVSSWRAYRKRPVRSGPAAAHSRRSRLNVEMLEDRIAPAVFNVNSLADILNPPLGVVTLRSAIEATNATAGSNTINLTVAGTYAIKLAGAGEDNNATGDFDILPAGGDDGRRPPESALRSRITLAASCVITIAAVAWFTVHHPRLR